MKTRIITAAAIVSIAFSPAAFASDRFEIDFDYSPVEVATPEGAEKAYNKLEEMITDECEPNSARERVMERRATEECIDRALDDAVAKMDKPKVTSIHEARRG